MRFNRMAKAKELPLQTLSLLQHLASLSPHPRVGITNAHVDGPADVRTSWTATLGRNEGSQGRGRAPGLSASDLLITNEMRTHSQQIRSAACGLQLDKT